MYAGIRSSWLLAAVSAASLLPGAQAYCYFDDSGYEHCTLSNALRTGIAIAIIVVALLFFASALHYRRRRMGQTTFFTTQRPPQNAHPSYAPTYPAGYNAQGGYYPNGPQYPPNAFSGYAAPVTPYSAGDEAPPAYYAPPAGPPPAHKKAEDV